MSFQLTEVIDTINSKKNIYIAIIERAFKVGADQAENIFLMELENFKERSKTYYTDQKTKPTLTVLQGTNIFLEVLQQGLSFSQSSGLVYMSRLKGTGTAMGYEITVYGKMILAQQSGAISHITEPVIIRKDEVNFVIKTDEWGRLIAHHTISFSDVGDFKYSDFKVGYCYIVYPDGTRELSFTDKNKMDKSFNLAQSKEMYNDITFLQTKVLKRAISKIRKIGLPKQMEVMKSFVDDDVDLDLDFETTQKTTDEVEVVEQVEAQPSDEFSFNF